MPELTIPLIGEQNQRGIFAQTALAAGQDSRVVSGFLTVYSDSIKGERAVYLNKRNGWETQCTPASGSLGLDVIDALAAPSLVSVFTNTGTLTNVVWRGKTAPFNCGSFPYSSVSSSYAISSGVINNENVVYITDSSIAANSSVAYYLADGATVDSFTGTTHTNTTVDGIATTVGLYVGQPVSKADLQAGTRIASIDSGTQITVTLAATGSSTGTVTVTRLAKIIDSDFTTNIRGPIVEMDGFLFLMDSRRRVYNSDVNSNSSWSASSYIVADQYVGEPAGVVRYLNFILAFSSNHVEFLSNAGNSFGSVLVRNKELTKLIGAPFASAITRCGNTVAWIGMHAPDAQNVSSMAVYVMEGTEPKKISNNTVDNLLNLTSGQFNGLDDVSLRGYTYLGRDTLHLSLCALTNGATQAFSMVYDFSTGKWQQSGFTYAMTISSTGGAYSVARNNTSGIVYLQESDTPTFQDATSQTYSLICQTQPYYLNNGLPFTIDNISLIADTQSSGSTTLATSADDYATFVTIGSFDLTQQQKNLAGGGYYDASVAFKLTDSGNNAWRGQALNITWRPFQ